MSKMYHILLSNSYSIACKNAKMVFNVILQLTLSKRKQNITHIIKNFI